MKKISDTHLHMLDTDFSLCEAYLDSLADIGVTDASILALAGMFEYDTAQNISVLYWKEKYKKINLRAFGSFHENGIYGQIPYEKQAEELLLLGCDGVKFLNMKPEIRKMLGKGLDHLGRIAQHQRRFFRYL